MEFTEYFNIRS